MHHIALLDEENDAENNTPVKTARYKVKNFDLKIKIK